MDWMDVAWSVVWTGLRRKVTGREWAEFHQAVAAGRQVMGPDVVDGMYLGAMARVYPVFPPRVPLTELPGVRAELADLWSERNRLNDRVIVLEAQLTAWAGR